MDDAIQHAEALEYWAHNKGATGSSSEKMAEQLRAAAAFIREQSSDDVQDFDMREALAVELARWRGHGQREKTYAEAERIIVMFRDTPKQSLCPGEDQRECGPQANFVHVVAGSQVVTLEHIRNVVSMRLLPGLDEGWADAAIKTLDKAIASQSEDAPFRQALESVLVEWFKSGDGDTFCGDDVIELLDELKTLLSGTHPYVTPKQANGRAPRKAAVEQMNVGHIRKAIESLPDDTPIWVCDDYNYGKFYRAGYQPVTINHDELGYELFIEFQDEGGSA